MLKAERPRLPLATTITGSMPRPAWFDLNLGERPFRDAMADARFREQYHGRRQLPPPRSGARRSRHRHRRRRRFDTDVGGMSWFQYPARRFKGLAGGDYQRVRKGYGGTAKGDIIFEVMESRVMPRCVGKIERGRCNTPRLEGGAGLTDAARSSSARLRRS